ncbi:hypothetical protein BJ508DRAFT_414890 [Ascobolus immersus RN42]|uniref:ARID domain-containing protein n=1 Tax=Ascobolus immersus RN42 TaxID=1160509 RepID=A0A3N4I558_ASCIM|nr:hypothetical protein BJ508DRAFT_414890 [Ascobolus immersus RN42]
MHKSQKNANRVVDDSDIERTEEYEQFMAGLKAYHEKRGTDLVQEPELGRRKLDLLKLYKKILDLGGYDKVTEEKGAWRNLATSYKLTGNTTNAGFLLKTIYYKNLAAYEISTHWGKEPPPKEYLEDRSAAGGAIQTRNFEDYADPSDDSDEEKQPTPPPNLNSGRSLRQAPARRELYQPPITPARGTASRTTSNSNMQATNHTIKEGSPPSSIFFPSSREIMHPISVSTPANNPALFQQQRMVNGQFRNGYQAPERAIVRLGENHQGAHDFVRAFMGLKSGLPDEVAFGLARLVEYSDKHPSLIPSPNYPGLLELVIVKACAAKELETKVSGSSRDDFDDSMETKELHKELDLVANAMLILRNIVTDDLILNELVKDHRVQMFYEPLVSILSLPSRPCFFEIKNYALETLEYTAQYLVIGQDSLLLDILKRGIESDDRNELMRSLRALGTLGSAYESDAVNYLGQVPLKYFELCIPQLMLNDTELLLTCLDFLYNYTSVDGNLDKVLKSRQIIPLVEQCVRLLEHNTRLSEEHRALYRMAKPKQVNEIPAIPSEILTELISYPEPERATKWMRCCFEEDPEAEITQIALWQAYQSRFSEFSAHQNRPLLPAADFIKNVSVAFSRASAMVINQQGQSKFIIKGIRMRESPMAPNGTVYIPCKWRQPTPIPQPGGIAHPYRSCTTQCQNPRDLFDHILKTHLPQPPEPQQIAPINGDIQMGGAAVDPSLAAVVPTIIHYSCNWDRCGTYQYPNTTTNRQIILGHIKTHLPPSNPGAQQEDANNRTVVNTLVKNHYNAGFPGNVDPRVALSATLLLKNFSRNRTGKELLFGVRKEICEVAVLQDIGAPNDPLSHVGRDVRKYLMELLVDSDLNPNQKK